MDLIWLIVIPMYPILGVVLYLTLRSNKRRAPIIKKIRKNYKMAERYYIQDPKIKDEIEKADHSQIKYLMNIAKFPAYSHNKVKYFPLGDDVYNTLLKELEKAEKYIFIEYYIIGEGEKWDGILSILKEKARQGLDVRIIYDDFGCLKYLPEEYICQY